MLPAPGLAYIAVPVGLSTESAAPNPTFEETGVNSAGVALSSTETIFSNDAVLAADPLNTATGLIEDSIASIILPQVQCSVVTLLVLIGVYCWCWLPGVGAAAPPSFRGLSRPSAQQCQPPPPSVCLQATSARQGVELLGRYIQDIGSAEGFGIQFADAEEAW